MFSCRFLYLENRPLVSSSICAILLQGWFVVVFFSYIYKFQQAILKRKVLFISLSFSIHGTNHGHSFRIHWCQTLCLPLLCKLNKMHLFSYNQTILVSVISGVKYNCISNPICVVPDLLLLCASLGSFPASLRNFCRSLQLFFYSPSALFLLLLPPSFPLPHLHLTFCFSSRPGRKDIMQSLLYSDKSKYEALSKSNRVEQPFLQYDTA